MIPLDKQQLEAATLGSLWRETTQGGHSTLFMRTRQGGLHGLIAIATNVYDLDEMGQFIAFDSEEWEIFPSILVTCEQVGVITQVRELLVRGE